MRFALLALLVVPASIAVKCWNGVAVGDESNGAFIQVPCGDNTVYCYKQDINLLGVRTITKSCDFGMCTGVGTDVNTGITCCKGDYCNSASGTSLLMTSLVALMAAWMSC